MLRYIDNIKGKELQHEYEMTEDETSFVDNPNGELDPDVQPSVNLHNDPKRNAHAIFLEGGLPGIDTIIATKGKGKDIDPKLLAVIVTVEKPQGESGLKALIQSLHKYVRGGRNYENFVTDNFLTRKQLDDYLKQTPELPVNEQLKQTPVPPSDTPSVPL